MSLLTGTASRSSAPLRVVETKAPPKEPDRIDELLEVVRGSMDYVKAPAEERAKREAEPLIEQERVRLAAEAARVQAEHHAALAARASEIENLRRVYGEVDSQRADLQAQLLLATEEAGRSRAASEAALAAREREIAELRARPSQVIREPAPPAPAPAPVPRLKPEDISFEWHRSDVTGLLRGVVLRAKGYEDLVLEIERRGDNRMHNLKVKGG